jgi:hypothetical protein
MLVLLTIDFAPTGKRAVAGEAGNAYYRSIVPCKSITPVMRRYGRPDIMITDNNAQ